MESGKMLRLIAVAGLGLLITLAGACRHKQEGADWPDGPVVTVAVPDTIDSGADGVFTVLWIGGTAPYTLSLDLGDPALENVPPGTPAASPFTHTTRFLNPDITQLQYYTYRATVVGHGAPLTLKVRVWGDYASNRGALTVRICEH